MASSVSLTVAGNTCLFPGSLTSPVVVFTLDSENHENMSHLPAKRSVRWFRSLGPRRVLAAWPM